MVDYIDENVVAGLVSDVGQDNFVLIADMYCADSISRAELISAAIAGGDVTALAAQCHALKGGSLSVGAAKLGDVMEHAEAAAKAGELERSIEALVGFREIVDKTIGALKSKL